MELNTWPNLVSMFFTQAERHGDRPFLWQKRDGAYQAITWSEAAAQVSALARALTAWGLAKGDRVLLLSENAPHWAIADFAIMAAGGVTVPVYTTNTAHDHAHILTDSGATMAVVSTAALAAPFLEAAADAPDLRRVVVRERPKAAVPGHVALATWDEALAAGAGAPGDPAADALAIPRDSLACIIYTSGTGGAPKGVMLSHRAILCNCVGAYHLLRVLGLGDEVFLSFLPLSHSYEHSCGLMFPVSIGAQIYYAERVETLTTNLVEARPTIMTAVPRLYEVMRERILSGVRRQGGLKARLFWTAVDLGRKRIENPSSLGLLDRVLDAVVDRLVRNKVRARFGGRLKALVSGGAPLNYDIGIFFAALGLRLLQGYGQTEAAPVISCNPPDRENLRSVGPALHEVELRIAGDGEILVRGPLLMNGYWKQPETTRETLRDGWLHTGDIGHLDQNGYLHITDRKKDIIVNSGGDNISPQRVESILGLEPEIEFAMVAGDRRPHLVGVLVPSQAFIDDWAKTAGAKPDLDAVRAEDGFRKSLADAVARANRRLPAIERVKRFVIAEQPFTVNNGMMTPTMKLRRHEIMRRYGSEIEALY